MTNTESTPSGKRAYHSPMRQRQAEEARQHILRVSRILFLERGYAGTTMEAIAEGAGVSVKTVSAVLGAKREIFAEVVNPANQGNRLPEFRAQLLAATNTPQRVALVAHLALQVYSSSSAEFDLLRGAGVIAPELAEITQTIEQRRWHQQRQFVVFLQEQGGCTTDRLHDEVIDEIWTLTSYDVYRKLVTERGWSAEQYEAWLAKALMWVLLPPV